jgi:hypothetical protein
VAKAAASTASLAARAEVFGRQLASWIISDFPRQVGSVPVLLEVGTGEIQTGDDARILDLA